MALKDTRIDRLKALARLRNAAGPVELGKIIGKNANQTSDLLAGRASFGEKVARSIERSAELPLGWLDRDSGEASYWPFSEELQQLVERLGDDDLKRLENVMRAHLGVTPLSAPPLLTTVAGRPSPDRPAPALVQELTPPASTPAAPANAVTRKK